MTRALLIRDRPVQHRMIREAIALVAELPDPSGFCALITSLVPPWEGGSSPRDALADDVPAATMEAIYTGDHATAVERLLADLTALEASDAPVNQRLRVASRLAVLANSLSDSTPGAKTDLARLTAGLAQRYRAAVAAHQLDSDGRSLIGAAANNVGWAAVNLYQGLPGAEADELLLTGIAMLERAVELGPADKDPMSYSASASNLATGYRSRARRLTDGTGTPLLHRALELMRSVLAVDERLVEDGLDATIVALDIDHLNLGFVHNDLAHDSYDAQWISRKSPESADHWLAAAQHFDQARTIALAAGEFARAGTAASMTAHVAATICGWYLRERSHAGGDLQPAMYEWLCRVAGVAHVSTADFVVLCAGTALEAASEAALIGQQRNASLLMESLQVLQELYDLAERQLYNLTHLELGLSSSVGRDIRMTILERLHAVADAGLDRANAERLAGFDDVLALLSGQFLVDLFELTKDPGYLRRGWEKFDELVSPTDPRADRNRDPVVRALARPRVRWLDAAAAASGATICGLSLAGRPDGLVLRIPAQGREVMLGGLVARQTTVGLLPTGDARELARFATAHLRPLLDWEPLPAAVATVRATGRADSNQWQLDVVALPMPTWDSWMMRVTATGSGPIRLRPGLPFLGVFEPTTGGVDPALPGAASDHTQVLLFGGPGLTLHVLLPADLDSKQEAQLRVSGTATEPELEVVAAEAFLLLQATPRISASQVAFLIKTDSLVSAAACAASFWPDFPDPGMPATAVQVFSALFPFGSRIADSALAQLDELTVTVTVMVGLPDERDQLDQLLAALADPRRELLLVVDAEELARASEAAAELLRRVRSSLSAGLLESAASSSTYHEALSGLQVVCAPRASAPAAVQMLLDLAALRKVNPDDVPETIDGKPVYLSTKGNPTGMRRLETLFTEPASFADLLDRYVKLGRRGSKKVLGEISPIREQLTNLTIPRRPVLMLAPDDPAVVAAVPLARHLGAIVLFADADGLDTCAALSPAEVYAVPAAAARLLDGPWTVSDLPADPADLAGAVQKLIVADHLELLASLSAAHPSLVAGRELLTEMGPENYAVLVTDSPTERPWAFLVANYAAALSAPVLVVDGSLPQRDARLSAADRLLEGSQWRREGNRDLTRRPAPDSVPIGLEALGRVGVRLEALGARYLGFMTPRADFPIELVGEPPLAARYALGRLAGPDLESTALLVVRAALAEDVPRPTRIGALVADAAMAVADAPLPGAHAEAAAVHDVLRRQPNIDTTVVHGLGDLFDFIAGLRGATLVHFAGHGRYDVRRPNRSGLVFESGVLSPRGMLDSLGASPIIFSNACESGVLDVTDEADGGGAAWTGLAATFLLNGATNYLGSLWPIDDQSSRALAETFYQLLCAGTPVGEALRQARLAVRAVGDPTWAAFVLFGCPRNRVRPSTERLEIADADPV